MFWPAHSQTFVLLAMSLTFVSAVPLAEGSHGEHSDPATLNESDQLSHPLHRQDQGMVPEDGNMPGGEIEKVKSHQVRSAASHPSAQREPSYDDELFKDVDAKTLAAILIQALKVDEDKPSGSREEPRWHSGGVPTSTNYRSPEAGEKDSMENVKSRTRVSKTQWSPPSQESEDSERRGQEDEEDNLTPQSIDRLEAMLQDMEKYSTATKRERSNTAQRSLPMYSTKNNDESNENDVLRDLDAFEELVGRKDKYSNYEENQEDARGRVKYGAEDLEDREGDRRKVGQERAADRASDLLLQYLLRGEASEEEEEEEKVREDQRADGGSEESASEEKRADEDEDEDEDIDPQTIDRLIEISSKLHLPADDVIDIINDVEKKRKDPAERVESKHGASSRDRFRYSSSHPDSNYLPRHRPEKARHHTNDEMSLQQLLGAENALDYESMPFTIPRRYRPRPNGYPNYIRPWIYQQRHRPYYYQPPPPVYRNKDYYEDETQDNEEELENYIEKIFLKHPEVFQ
ncbi:neurosecretory protein VGF-like [Carcharodon carcharias]|uniref:neurosecretory protein VGF-like n=1 Tax=Carcharodon carcharias TaxID=13397 RepID=UPI001B7DE964|nr:neurosecretory protein VGF-like [Carcharodon carcharias]